MRLIEEKLHQIHAEAKLQSQQKSGAAQTEERGEREAPLRGFAKINIVTGGSPADLAVSLTSLVYCAME